MTDPIEDMGIATAREPRRRPSAVAVGVAALALVGALAACQPPEENPGSGDATTTTEPDATESATDEEAESPADEDTDGGTDDETDGGAGGGTDAGLPDFSEAVFPECGDSFAGLPDRSSDLVVETGPSEALPDHGGGWMTTVTNNGSELVQGQTAMMEMIIVDAAGTVVGTVDPDDDLFLGAEGPSWMGVAAGESLDYGIQVTPSCETDDWLPAGDYQAYAAVTFVNSEGDFGDMEQAQGGPWDLTIGGGDSTTAPIIPSGAVPVDLECGQPWENPAADTAFEMEMLYEIRSPRAATDDIDGSAAVTTGGNLDGLLFTQVLIMQDGVIMNHRPGSDTATTASATAGANLTLDVSDPLYRCDSASDPKALPTGGYEAVVVLVTANEEGTHVLAATDPVALELT